MRGDVHGAPVVAIDDAMKGLPGQEVHELCEIKGARLDLMIRTFPCRTACTLTAR
jgi:hypothetical protein